MSDLIIPAYSNILVPYFGDTVSAGFPNPAEGSIDHFIDLNQLMIRHPNATFFARAKGDSMLEAGILDGDLLVVDRSLTPQNQDIVLAYADGGFLVKRLITRKNRYYLQAENKNFPFIPLLVSEEVLIWGVVSGVTRTMSNHS